MGARQNTLDMIEELQARLVDLKEVVDAYEGSLKGYANRLDQIDDKLYLIQREIEEKTEEMRQRAIEEEENRPPTKEEMKEVVSDFAVVAKESGETLKELNSALGDITGVFRKK